VSVPFQAPGRPLAASLRLGRGRGWTVALVATLVMSVSYIDRQALAALAPTVCKALAISHEQYGVVIAAFSVAYLVGAPLAGALLDRTGARRGLVYAILAWSAVAAVQALVPGYGALIALRVGLGLAESPSFPGAAQSVRRALPKEHRSAGFGLLFTGSSIGGMVAAPLAIAINERWNWRVAFVGTALVGLAWVPLWLGVTARKDVREALGRVDEDEGRLAAPSTSRLALVLTAPVLRATLLVVASAPTIMFGLNFLSHYLADVYSLKQGELAAYLWVPPIFFDLGAVAFGALASRLERGSPEPISHRGLMLVAGALSATMVVMPFVHSPALATALASSSLMGGGAIFALLTADMLARVHPTHVSVAGGLTAAAQSLAYVVASILVGRIYDQSHSYTSILIFLGAVVPPVVLVWCAWPMLRKAPAR
jgi:ACS family hexuronate transporter-like MFS transporter